MNATLPIPDHLPRAKEAPVQGTALTAPAPGTELKRSPEEEARDILATAAKNQPEDGTNTRRAAVRACKYLRAMVNQYETTIQAVHIAARTHTQKSKGTVGPAVDYVQTTLPKLEVKMIEFLAEWMVTLLMPASHVLEVRAPHLSFMMLKEYWFRELYLGLKVTASFDRSESYTRVIDGQVRCIKAAEFAAHLECAVYHSFRAGMDNPTRVP